MKILKWILLIVLWAARILMSLVALLVFLLLLLTVPWQVIVTVVSVVSFCLVFIGLNTCYEKVKKSLEN